jgi:hypothetical protein
MPGMDWDTSHDSPEDLTVEGIVMMVEGCGGNEDQVVITDREGNALRLLGVRTRDYRVEVVTDQSGREPYVQDDTTEDDRPSPSGESNDARLLRYVKSEVTDRRIRRDGIEPVTLTGSQIFDLLSGVAERFYNHARIDLDSSVRQLPPSWSRP